MFFCSSLNNGHQGHLCQPCADRSSCSFRPPKWGFSSKKLNFLRANEAHRSASSSRQRIDHPHPEGLTTRLVPVEVDLKPQIFDVCSSLNNGHSPKGRLRQLFADIVAKVENRTTLKNSRKSIFGLLSFFVAFNP